MATTTIEDLLKAVNDASGAARTTWMTFILFGAYLAVAVGATTQAQFLLEAPIQLPLLGVRLPLRAFYQVVPGLFVLMHLYMLVQLYLLSRTLHLLNAEIEAPAIPLEERERVRARIDSFLVSQLISGKTREWLARLFMRFAAWISLLAAPVVLLLAFQVQFLAYHDVLTTWIERITLIVDLFLIWLLWPAIVHPSGRFGGALSDLVGWAAALLWRTPRQIVAAYSFARKNAWRIPSSQELWAYLRVYGALRHSIGTLYERVIGLVALVVICGGAVVFSLLVATIPGEAIELWLVSNTNDLPSAGLPASCKPQTEQDGAQPQQPTDPGASAPQASARDEPTIARAAAHAIRSPASRLLACLFAPIIWTHRTAAVTSIPPDPVHPWPGQAWWPTAILFEGAPDPVRSSVKSWFTRNIVLIDADLIGADSEKLDKVRRTIVLRGRDLRNAVLDRADLRKADLTGAQLAGASLQGTRLESANLTGADLENAALVSAELQNANLASADLNGANLGLAQLQGAHLENAQLQGANLYIAALTGAQLTRANLEGAILSAAHVEGADLYSSYLDGAQLNSAHLEAADLRFAHLAGADLGSTHLEGADLGYAQMQEVSLRSAYVWRALAAGLGDSFAHADVRGINGWPRDQSQLASSILQWLASIPPGSLHDDAQRRFSTLTSVLQLDEERKLFAPWMRAMASIWDEGREDLLLADLLESWDARQNLRRMWRADFCRESTWRSF